MKATVFLFIVAICSVGVISQDRKVCFVGTRVTTAGKVSSNTIQANMTCASDSRCWLITIGFISNGRQSTIEDASCVSADLTASACDNVAQENSASATSCMTSNCSSFACNSPASPEGCPDDVLENDMQLFPNCTIRETLRKVFDCAFPLESGYPYGQISECSPNINSSLRCVTQMVEDCLSPFCSTILDNLPFNIRGLYSRIINGMRNLTAFNLPPGAQESFNAALCFLSSSEVLQNLTRELEQSAESSNTSETSNLICDATFFRDVLTWTARDFRRIMQADSREEFCSAFTSLKTQTLDGWRRRCNRTAAIDLFINRLPREFAFMTPALLPAIRITEEMLDDYQLDNCTNTQSQASATTTPMSASMVSTASMISTVSTVSTVSTIPPGSRSNNAAEALLYSHVIYFIVVANIYLLVFLL